MAPTGPRTRSSPLATMVYTVRKRGLPKRSARARATSRCPAPYGCSNRGTPWAARRPTSTRSANRVWISAWPLGPMRSAWPRHRWMTGPGDGAFGVVDDRAAHHPAERPEGAAGTGQPGGGPLIAHQFGVLMARPAQGHHEEPGLDEFPGVDLGDHRPGAEIDLGRLPRLEARPQRHRRRGRARQLAHEAMDRGITPRVAVAAPRGRMDGRPLEALIPPGDDRGSPRFQPGHALGRSIRRAGEDRRQGRVMGQRNLGANQPRS